MYAQVPHFRDGPFGRTLRSANIWTAHPDRPVSCEEIKTPPGGGFFALRWYYISDRNPRLSKHTPRNERLRHPKRSRAAPFQIRKIVIAANCLRHIFSQSVSAFV